MTHTSTSGCHTHLSNYLEIISVKFWQCNVGCIPKERQYRISAQNTPKEIWEFGMDNKVINKDISSLTKSKNPQKSSH